MTAIEIIEVISQSMFIFVFVITIIACAIYAALSLSKEAKQAKEEEESAEEEADAYFKRVETKLDQLLKLHGCDVCEDSIIRSTHNVYEKLTEINDKLSVFLCGPLDEETLKELRAEREANKE